MRFAFSRMDCSNSPTMTKTGKNKITLNTTMPSIIDDSPFIKGIKIRAKIEPSAIEAKMTTIQKS